MQPIVTGIIYIAITVLSVVPSKSDVFRSGPFQDFKGTPGIITGCSHVICDTSFDFGSGLSIDDQFQCKDFCPRIGILGLAYVAGPTPDFNIGDLRITTVYGLDLNPMGQSLEVTGFDPTAPQLTLIPPETFVGKSGTAYFSDFFAVANLAELSALLPGFDLSPFRGDPGSIVYVFDTTVPAGDTFPAPEPSTLALMLPWIILAWIASWRHTGALIQL